MSPLGIFEARVYLPTIWLISSRIGFCIFSLGKCCRVQVRILCCQCHHSKCNLTFYCWFISDEHVSKLILNWAHVFSKYLYSCNKSFSPVRFSVSPHCHIWLLPLTGGWVPVVNPQGLASVTPPFSLTEPLLITRAICSPQQTSNELLETWTKCASLD